MNRRNFLAGVSALAVASCARTEKRAARYNAKQCPFCSQKAGACSYCGGTSKCSFCKGTGKRTTVVPAMETETGKTNKTNYEEACPYCTGSGKCHYCDGVGKCWACKGTGSIEDWNAYERDQAQRKAK